MNLVYFLAKKNPNVFYVVKWLFIGALISFGAGSASAFFLQSLEWATAYRESHLWIIVFLPVGGFVIGLAYKYYGEKIKAGNNILIEAILYNTPKKIPFRMAPFVYAGTIITHALGGSAGREGTALQMAGAISDAIGRFLKIHRNERKTLIVASIAAGFGSVFGTPLAGALFALEIAAIGSIRYNAIFPVFISSIFADLVTTKLWNVEHTSYAIFFIPDISFIHIAYCIAAGALFGLCAMLFSILIHKTTSIFQAKIFSFSPIRPVAGGIIVVLGVWILGTSKYIGLGIPIILESFEKPLPMYDFALKIAFTIITLSSGFKGGEVTPLFFIGAALGSALSLFIPLPTGLLAGMGFVAVFAGATNTPLACSLMAIELFGSEVGVYAALACTVSYLFSGHTGIYDRQRVGEPKHNRLARDKGKGIYELL